MNTDTMSVTQIHQKLEKGYADEILTLDTFPERFRIMDSELEKRMELRRMRVNKKESSLRMLGLYE